MILSPFSLLSPYADRLHVALLTKEDAIGGDDDVLRACGAAQIVSLRQLHGNRTIVVREPSQRTEEADGALTDQPGLWLTTRCADCQSFLVFAPQQNVVGVLHAGWRGLVNGAIPSFFQKMQEEWGIAPSETLVGIGPSLGFDHAEFSDPAAELPGIDPRFFDRRLVDLPGIADRQLADLGIPAAQRERITDCTVCHSDRYWSYRGGDADAVRIGKTNVLAGVLFR
jgi:polyphenol oxidase